MEKYNYRAVMKADIKEWLLANLEEIAGLDINDAAIQVYDILWDNDEITGNGGDWYDTEYNCEEYVCHNLNLLFAALIEFGELEESIIDVLKKNSKEGTIARWADCTIRCYLLMECVWEVLEGWYRYARPEKN